MNLFWRKVFFGFCAALMFGMCIGLILGNMKEPKITAQSLMRINVKASP